MELSSPVAVVADSIACLPPELAERYQIRVMPVDLVFEGKVYRDGLDLTPSQFYQMLKEAKKPPTTSPPSVGSYLEAYRDLARRAKGILCVTVGSGVTAIYESARLAKEMAQEVLPGTEVVVFDSGTAGMAEGFVALEAARAAEKGASLREMVEVASNIRQRVSIIACLETLYYLARGGRIPKAAAWAGSLLHVKPILEIRDSKAGLVERPRTWTQAEERLLAIMKKRTGGQPVHVAVMHADNQQGAERLREKVASQFQCLELYTTEFPPAMAAHAGPGLLGLSFYADS